MTKKIKINHQIFVLHHSGAMFWEKEKMLIISDVHLGKISHFRKYGSAVPQEAIAGNFKKLSKTVAFFNPEKICFLGDLFHSSINKEWLLFENWKNSVLAEVILIEGNHDIISPLKYENLNVKVISGLAKEGFLFTHHPENREGFFNFSGHLHPGVKISGKGRQELKLPCFFKTKNQLILPAFGEFTGNYFISAKEGDEVFVVTEGEVILLPSII